MDKDPRTRHLPPVPKSVFVLLDALLLAAVGFALAAALDPSVAVAAGWGGLASPGFRQSWVFAQATVLPLAFIALRQYRFLGEPGGAWSFPRIVLAATVLDLGLLLYLRLLGWPNVDRTFIVLDFLAGTVAVCLWRAIAQARLRRMAVSGKRVRNVLFVGGSGLVAEVGRMVAREPALGRRVVGFAGDPPAAPAPPGAWVPAGDDPVRAAVVENSLRHPRHIWAGYPASDDEARRRILDGLNVEEVYLGPRRDPVEIAAWLRLCQERGVDTHFIPDHHVELGIVPEPWQLGPYVMLDVHRRPFSPLGWWAKRAMDVAGALVGLVLSAPIVLATAVAIKVEHPSLPVFYPGRRVGLKGRIFRMAKFTTMRPDAQKLEETLQAENQREGPWFKLEADKDPRLTRVGRFIRKYSINEIPQFWNVLKGDMSLVGPRPPIPEEVATYLDYDVRYFHCLDVKPGMTGLWQVTAKNDPSFDRRIQLDLEYMQNWSIWRDVKIMLKTVASVVKDKED